MKIRTDFVTNSSSSSFVVNLKLQFLDGISLTVTQEEISGDEETKSCAFTVAASDGNVITREEFAPMYICVEEGADCDPYDIPYDAIPMGSGTVDLCAILNASDPGALAEAVKVPFGLDCAPVGDSADEDDYEEEIDYDEDETGDFVSLLRDRQAEFGSALDGEMSTYLAKPSDLKSASVSMEFSGMGEWLADSEEILERVFGHGRWHRISAILSGSDEAQIMAKLRAMRELNGFTDESLERLIRFRKDCDYTPEKCVVEQHLLPGGLIDMTIEWT